MRSDCALLAVLLAACSPAKSHPSATDKKEHDSPCPEGMAYIPPATFMMGTADPNFPSTRLHQVTLTKPYCIDRTPVTVAAYQRCVNANGCTPAHKPLDYNYERPGRDNHPINGIDWTQANAYCTWAGKRLPTSAEWELAARGTDGRKYPWGNQEPDDSRLCWSHTAERDSTCPVDAHPAGASSYGVLEMLGNVSQWVAGFPADYGREPEVDPVGPTSGEARVIRGAGYLLSFDTLLVGESFTIEGTWVSSVTGTRCSSYVAR